MKKSSSLLSVIGSRLHKRLLRRSSQSEVTNSAFNKPKFAIEELEQRVLYSADDPLNASISSLDTSNHAVVRVVKTPTIVHTDAKNTHQRELVIIDERVDDIETLQADFQSQIQSGKLIEVVVVHRDEDGFSLITNKLQEIAQRGEQVSALHLIGHGSDQQMQLGQIDVSASSIKTHQASIQDWSKVLTNEADILLYGCDFAKSEAGKNLVQELSVLSRADVAASTNITGNPNTDGDWALEYQSGVIDTQIILSANGQHQYLGRLSLTTQGTETIVNTVTTGNQITAPTVNSIAIDSNGNYVVVFTGATATAGNDIFVQRYNASGVAQGGNVTVNTTATNTNQQNATVAMDAATGNFIVAWDGNGTGDSTGVFYRRFNADGTAADATEIRANFTTTGVQSNAVIAMNSLSDFYLAWTDSTQDSATSGIYARRFNNFGALSPGDVRINSTATDAQTNASIATAPGKGIVVTWESNLQDGNLTGIYFRQFDATLTATSNETLVNTITVGAQARPTVDMNASGSFVIAWHGPSIDSNLTGVAVQRYDVAGVAVGSNIRVNSYQTGNQDRANASLADDGTFVVTWVSAGQDVTGTNGVYGQAFNANGTSDGAEFQINTSTLGNQAEVSLAYNGDKAVAVWSGNGTQTGNVDAAGVFMQRYVRPNVIVSSLSTTTSEGGTTATFSVVLNTAPTANVTIGISSSNTAEGNVSSSTLIFTSLDWSTPQIVTVTGVNDSYIDGAINYSIAIAAAVSTDLRYNGIDAADLQFTNADDDTINTVVVNTTSDVSDGNVTSIAALYANKGADGVISLREAMLAANATANGAGGADRIEFNIAGGGVRTIAPTSALPTITQALTIDGFTQAGSTLGNLQAGTSHNLNIRLDGTSAGNLANAGLLVQANNVTIRGLNISGWAGNTNSSAIRVESAQNVLIEGNYLGTNAAGSAANANANAGIYLVDSSNSIFRNNLISGNGKSGITLTGTLTANNLITSNLIGVNATNSVAIGNATEGVLITGGASNNRVGGIIASDANVIANNAVGVAIVSGTDNAILGNSFFKNVGLAIDLGNVGVNANDANDLDSGANDLLNFPSGITAEKIGTDLVINAQMVSGLANTSYRIEIYSNPASSIEISNHGEGQTFLGAITVSSDALGNALINATILGVTTSAPSGSKISLTATRSLGGGIFGSTSEFAFNAIAGFKPVVQIPLTAPTATEDVLLNLSGISVNDADSDVTSVQASVLNGQLGISLAGGATVTAGAIGTATFTVSGTQAQINATLATLNYQGNNGYNGSERLRLTALDSSNLSDTKDLFFSVTAVNDAPTISAPSGTQSIISNIPKIFSIANANAIQITDVDAGSAQIEVSIASDASSTVSLNGTTGLTFTIGDGSLDNNMVFRGTLSAINAALNGLAFNASSGTLINPTLTVSVNDLGNTGTGGAQSNTSQINFLAYGIEIVDTGTRVTTESGGQHVLGIRLRNPPLSDVNVALSVLPPLGPTPIEATISTNNLIFTSSNWNVVQLVTVTGIDDAVVDGDKTYSVNIGPTTTLDSNYAGVGATSLTFINSDNEQPLTGGAVSISNIISTNISEAGESASFSVVLTSAPTANVTINLSVSDQTEGLLSISSITFTAANWNIAQVVTVTGLDDSLADGNASLIVITSATVSTDANYNGVAVQDIVFINVDNDTFNTVTVTTSADTLDGDTRSLEALYNNLGADGKISLREAILAANNTANAAGEADRINFSISEALLNGAHTINLNSALPSIREGVMIDGQSEPDWSAITRQPVIAINGSATAIGTDGLSFYGSSNSVKGIAINGFSGAAIRVYSGSALNTFSENYIGVKVDGTTPSANGIGIQFDSGSGSAIVTRNRIAFNANQAVFINASSGVLVDKNAMFGNGGLGIDLGTVGPQANDVLDTDIGPNGLQNFPVVTRAISGTSAQIEGYLHSTANSTFTVDFYAASNPDSSGFGEGERWLGAISITTNAQGYAQFSTVQSSVLAGLNTGEWITTTATSTVNGSTSEFGRSVQSTKATLLVSPAVIGNETLANIFTSGTQSVGTNNQAHGANAIDASGNSIVVWQSQGQDGDGWGVFGQRFDSSGLKVGAEFQISNTGVGAQTNPSVAIDGSGNFVVTWTDSNLDGSANSIALRRFSSAGSPLGATQLVNVTAAGDQTNPVIAMSSNGDFIISWTSNGQDGSGDGVYARAYNANGTSKTSEFRINDNAIGNQNQASVWIATDGSYRAVYSENGTIRLRNFSSLGVAQGASTRIDSSPPAYASANAVIDGASTGDFVVAWRQIGVGVNYDSTVVFQRFDNLGAAVGATTTVATGLSANSALRPGLGVQNTTGDFVLTWDDATRDGSGSGVYAKLYSNLGVALTGDWRANTTSTGNQTSPHVAINDNGQMVFAWDSTPASLDSDTGIFMQRFDRRGNTSEAGGSARFMAVLDAAPASNVVVQLNSSNANEGVSSPSSLTFTNSNWKTPQFVSVIGVDDSFIDGLQNYSITVGSVVSSDSGFNAISSQQVQLSNLDNDTANTITVTTTADTNDGNTSSLAALFSNMGADGRISLREAILAANNTVNGGTADRINFNISGSGPHVFSVLSALPSISDAILIDGTSEPDYLGNASPIVVIDGTSAGIASNGIALTSTANNSTIQGLLIRNFSRNGIITDASNGLYQNNRIESNLLSGIGISSATAQSNSILQTVFNNNGGLGIDLGSAGVNLNDANDADSGANSLQNFPVLTSATTNGASINLTGSLNSLANTSYRIEYYRVITGDSSGFGEASEYLGFVNVTTNASGFASFATNTPAIVATTDKLTATATRINGSNSFETSEFSQNINVLAPGVNVTPLTSLTTSESGTSTSFNIVLTAAPTADVTINFTVSDTTEGSLSISSVTFTVGNWMTPQTVTVSGLNDTIVDGNVSYTIITSNAVSTDANYNGRTVADVTVINNDDDTVNTIFVDTISDIVDGDTSSISALMSNLGTDGRISLREAILATNATANGIGGSDIIKFNLAGVGSQFINVNSALPTITDSIFIDGQSLSGFSSANRMVVINGNSAGLSANGFTIASSQSQISSLGISNFSGAGITVLSGTNNYFNQNLFVNNAGIAIDLGPVGVNTNDNLDSDTGANNLQNSPTLQAASSGSSTTAISGQLRSTPNSSFRIQLFSSATQHSSGTGEASNFLTQIDVTTNATGFAQYTVNVPLVIASGQFISATATLTNGSFTQFFDTSEFSKTVQVIQGPVLSADSNPVAYVENGTGIPIFSNALITAADTTQIDSVKVSILGGFQSSRDQISWTATGGIIANYDSNLGILSLTGTTTIANYQSILNSLRYSNSSDDPNTNARIFQFETTSGTKTSTTQFSLNVIAVNDPAQIVTNIALTLAEGSSNTISATQLTANDVDGINRNLIYQVTTGPASGILQRVTALGIAITSFTQGEIDDGLIQYVHSGNELGTDSFTFRISDGLSLSTLHTFNFIVTPVNDAPTLTTGLLGAAYIENGVAIRPLQGVVINDVDNLNLAGAVISLSNIEAADLLSFTNQNNISGSFNSSTKVLTLSGTSSIANYQAAIRSITYSSTSDFFSQTSKNVSVRVNDGTLNSNSVSEQITISNVNDTPQIAVNFAAIVAEGSSVTVSNAQLRFSDPDNAASQLTYTVSTAPINGRLELSTAPGVSISTFTQTDIDNARVIYVHNGSETTTDSFAYTVSDGVGGISATNTFSLSITAVDDLATIQMSNAPLAYTENAANTPIQIANSVVITDPDTPTLTQVRVRITAGYSAGNDILLVNGTLPAGITSSWNSGTGTMTLSGVSLLANYKTAIESLRYVNSSEFPDTTTRTITFSLTNSNGAQGTTSRQLDVISVNDAPVINIPGTSFTVQEDNAFTFSGVNRITLNDVDAQTSTIRVTLSVTNLGVGANLSLSQTNGLSFTSGTGLGDELMQFEGTLSSINAAINGLVFNPGTDFNGSNSIQITVDDRGNTGTLGGTLITSRTIAMNVTAVNDAPKISGALSAGVNGGASLTLTPTMIQATDVDSSNASLTFTVVSAFQHGSLMLLNFPGSPTAISTFTYADLQAGRVYYQHNNDSATLDSLDFIVTDGLATSNIATLDILISRNNVAPILGPTTNPTVTFVEQSPPVALLSSIVVSDVDSPLLRGATISFASGGTLASDRLIFTDMTFASSNVIRGSLDALGNLTLSGIATTSEYQTALRTVLFENTSAAPITTNRTIQVSVKDATLSSNTISVDVGITAVNNAPVINVTSGSRTAEDTAFSEIGAIHVVDPDIGNGLLSITLSSAHGLMSIDSRTGVVFQDGNGINNSTLTFTGTKTQINSALDSLVFLSNRDFNGVALIDIQVRDSGDQSGLNPLTDSATFQITVDPINDAPLLTDSQPTAITYSEGSTPIDVFRNVSINDIDSNTLTGATIQIRTGYVAAEDRLFVADNRGLSVTWDSTTGTISINGNGTIATYQGVLRSIQYQNISLSVSPGIRSISLTTTDESLVSAVAVKDVSVISIDDAPIINVGTLASFTENSASVSIFPELTLSDIDSVLISSADLRITSNYLLNSDLLALINTPNIAATWNPATATLSLVGSASVSAYETALRQIRFSSASDNLIDTTRSFTLNVTDASGTKASVNLSNFVITPVNDAPLASLTSNINILEDSTSKILSSLMGNLKIQDVDANQQNLSLVVAVNRGQLNIDPNQSLNRIAGLGSTEITLVGTLSQLSAAISNLVFVPEADFNGSLQLQISIEDLQGSRDTKFAQIQVIGVNDAPSISVSPNDQINATVGAATAILSTVSVKDVDSPLIDGAVVRVSNNFSAGDRIYIQSNPTVQSSWDANTGTLTLSGSASSQEYQNILQSLQFTTTSTNLNARTINLSLKDANGATSNVNKVFGFNALPTQNDTPTTNTGTTGNTTNSVPPAGTTNTGAPVTNPTTSSDTGIASTPSNSSLGTTAVNNALKAGASTVSLALLDTSGSQAVDENQANRDKRARSSEGNLKLANQFSSQLDALQSKTSPNPIKETDTDFRSTISSNSSSENRIGDSGARLLQIANRESSANSVGQSASLLLTLNTPEADETVQIKVSKAEQLAVDLLSLPVQSGGVVVSAAVLWWITRAGGILTALLTSLPSWQHFDPLPILTSTDGQPEDDWGDENEEDDKELDAILSQ